MKKLRFFWVMIFGFLLITLSACGGGGGGGSTGGGGGSGNSYDYATTVTSVASQYVNASSGGVVEVTDSTSSLKGLKLTIPGGALSTNTTATIGEVNNPPELPIGLNYVGVPINLEPDGARFNSPLTLEIPYYDEQLSDAGISDDTALKLYYYNESTDKWSEATITGIDTANNKIYAQITHFSYYAIAGWIGMQPEDLGIPQPGDLLYKTGNIFFKTPSKSWIPGHVGIYVGEKVYEGAPYNVIEALENGVTRSYYNPITEFGRVDLYMGAREPANVTLTSQQRTDIVAYVEAQVGKPYAVGKSVLVAFGMLKGSLVKGAFGSFNCVGLAEAAYETAGVNNGDGLVTSWQEDGLWGLTLSLPPVLTPAEQYNATKPAAGKNPSTPTNFTVVPVSSSQIDLSWPASTSTVTGYKVYKSGSLLKTVSGTSTSTSDTGLSPSTNYCYYVTAYNPVGESLPTSQACATTQAPPLSPPSTPAGFAVTASSSSQIDLAWTAPTETVTGYKIYKSGSLLKTVTTTSTSDTGLSPSTNYCYYVTAYNSAGESEQTGQTCATTPASSIFAGTIQLPQTGQTTCYDASGVAISCAGTGQDGDIRAGVVWPNPRFTDNVDGTATDNLTGLMWVKDANIMKTRDSGYDIDGTAGDGAVTWQHALDYIKKLNQENYLGHNDWRLSNINELISLVNNGLLGTSTWLNSQGFTNVRAGWWEYYWSSTNFFAGMSGTTLYVWCVSPQYNYVGPFGKVGAWYVWPVRTGQSLVNYPATGQNKCYNESGIPSEISCTGTGQDGDTRAGVLWPNPRYTDNGDGTVTDNLTGLMWIKDANIMKTRDIGYDTDGTAGDGAVTWQRALDYIKKLNQENYLGHNDWRLPNINELTSLVNYGLSPTSTWLSSQGFTIDLYAAEYWSSTSSIADTASGALIVHMLHGYVSDLMKNRFFCHLWPVRVR